MSLKPFRARASFELSERRFKIAELYSKGRAIHEIAQQVGLSERRVSSSLAEIRKQWQKETIQTFAYAVAEQLKEIEQIEKEAWEGWEKSKEPTIKTTATEGEGRVVSQSRKSQSGDPQFLTAILQCMERRAKLLGLYNPSTIFTQVVAGIPDWHVEQLLQENSGS